jgi:hypothetical protein
MNTFNIDDELDKLIDTMTETFRAKCKKLIIKHEKILDKQNAAAHKNTAVPVRVGGGSRAAVAPAKKAAAQPASKRRPAARHTYESDVTSDSD